MKWILSSTMDEDKTLMSDLDGLGCGLHKSSGKFKAQQREALVHLLMLHCTTEHTPGTEGYKMSMIELAKFWRRHLNLWRLELRIQGKEMRAGEHREVNKFIAILEKE